MENDEELFTHYDAFLAKYAGELPWRPVQWNVSWKDNIVLWQFTKKLKARDYFATAPNGLNDGDGNITTVAPDVWWNCLKDQPPVDEAEEDDAADEIDLYVNMTNQDMINLIYSAAKEYTSDPWNDWILPAGLSYLAIPQGNRQKPYEGPDIEDLPNLTEAQRNALLAALK